MLCPDSPFDTPFFVSCFLPRLVSVHQRLGNQDAVTASPQLSLLRNQIRRDVQHDFAVVVNELERRFRDMTQRGLGFYFRDALASAVVSGLGNDGRIHASTPASGSSRSSAGIGGEDKDEEVVRRALRSIAAKDADDRLEWNIFLVPCVVEMRRNM